MRLGGSVGTHTKKNSLTTKKKNQEKTRSFNDVLTYKREAVLLKRCFSSRLACALGVFSAEASLRALVVLDSPGTFLKLKRHQVFSGQTCCPRSLRCSLPMAVGKKALKTASSVSFLGQKRTVRAGEAERAGRCSNECTSQN